MRRMLLILVVLGVLIAPVAQAQERPVTIRYFGWSFFLVTTADGLRIAMYPFGNIGYTMPTVEADVVTVSHEPGDHNNVGLIRGTPRVFRGLGAGAADWNRIYALGAIDILMIPVGAGPFTVTPAQATAIAAQIRPKIIIPIHYKTPERQPPTWPGIDERAFLEGKQNVRRLGSHTLTITRDQLPSTTQIVVMGYQ